MSKTLEQLMADDSQARSASTAAERDERREGSTLPGCPPVDPPDPVAEWKRYHDERDADRKRATEERKREEREDREEIARMYRAQSADENIAHITDLLEVVRAAQTNGEALNNELSHVTRENRELKIRQAELETKLAELKLIVAEREGRKAILDLPNPVRSVN
jgi:hypothetical protein